ncbi:carboxypeptidase-like regulatory domain-containing protein [Oleiharenicola lentus]|uniref:carboxypeptidase-like regulatory domain-containing protein n=1 Tax=Oleiharenicola lentus TaxID=2508720 RepID=UPI003F66AF74
MHPTPHSSFVALLGRFLPQRMSLFALIAGVLLSFATGFSQESTTGTITGRVFNASSGGYLNNARVRVEGTSIEAYTNSNGEYTLRSVPAGEAKLRVTYSGQTDLRAAVAVADGQAAEANFTFNASSSNADAQTVVLDKFVVEAQRFKNAQELSINEERMSVNIKSVIATDALGYIKDGNIGEFVRFLPGVDVENGAFGAGSNPDNATTVAVRGFGADSTAVMIDGVPMASGSTSGLTRAVQLDALSINNASRLEIIKVATPDMRQDAPGGTINLITRGAFELARPVYEVSGAFNYNTLAPDVFEKTPGPYEPRFKTLPSIRASASIPLSKKIGITASAASDNKYSLTRRASMRDWFYTPRTSTGSGVTAQVSNSKGAINVTNPVVDRLELNESQWVEYRQSGNFRVDWRPIPELEIRANAQVSVFEGIGMNRRTQWRYSGGVGIKDWGEDYVTGYQRTATFNPSVSGSMNVDARDRDGFTSQGYITAAYNKGLWKVFASATASESFNTAPDRANKHFSSVDANLTGSRMDFVGINKGVVSQILLYDAAGNPLNYSPLSAWDTILVDGFRARSSQSSNRDLVKSYKLDVSRELDFLPFPMTVKAGSLYESKSNHRWGLGATNEMRYIGPNIANSEIQSPYLSEATTGYAQPQSWMDGHKIYQIYEEHPEYFTDQYIAGTTHTPAINYLSRVGNLKGLTETTIDYYGMATAKFFTNRLTVIGGGRQSRKTRKGYNVFNNPNYNFVTNADGTRYRDSVYTAGVRFDGNENTTYAAGDSRRAANAVLTDTALRTRMQAAGVDYLPTQLSLAPNGAAISNVNQNLFLAMRNRYTKSVDASRTEPITPQFIVDYAITDTLKAQVSWTKEHRLPDIEGNNALLVSGANFQITEPAIPDPSVLGGNGTITLSNVGGEPEINTSYNFKLAYYPKNGSGKYSISYYYKIVDNVWETIQVFNTSPDYNALLEAAGLSAEGYDNFRIDTTLALGVQQIRKGFEIELAQNFGILAPWARGIDAFVTYTLRPAPIVTSGATNLGYMLEGDIRAKWTGGLSYSARRFSVRALVTYTEPGRTHDSAPTVTLPDGTSRVLQLYNLNDIPPDVRVQANYVINKNFTAFVTAERLFSSKTYQLLDDSVDLLPAYANYRRMDDRGIAIAAGITATF